MTLKEKETYSQINECVSLIYQQRTILIIKGKNDILAVPTIFTKMQHNFFHYFSTKSKDIFIFLHTSFIFISLLFYGTINQRSFFI